MPFQPFGYHFEVRSILPPEQAKYALKRGWKGWFDAKRGPRGWFVGPWVCMWSSAYDQQGPMVFARLSHDGFGSKIAGRAGSDLNGILWFFMMGALLVIIALTDGDIALLLWMAIFSPVVLFILWLLNRFQKDADHLVRHIRVALGQSKPSPRPRTRALRQRGPNCTISVDGNDPLEGNLPDRLFEALAAMEAGEKDFVILDRGDGDIIQSAMIEDRFVIERFSDGERVHQYAVSPSSDFTHLIDLVCAQETLLCFIEGLEIEAPVEWRPGYAPDQ